MTRHWRLLLASLLATWTGMVIACGGGGTKSHPPTQETDATKNADATKLPKPDQNGEGPEASEKIIPYEVLKNFKRGDGKFVMDLLVSETASKEDVMNLAKSLQRQYDAKGSRISIYDSREAQQRVLDESYSDKELTRHFLVVIEWDLGREIRWVAEGRDLQAEAKAKTDRDTKIAANKAKRDSAAKKRDEEAAREKQQRREAGAHAALRLIRQRIEDKVDSKTVLLRLREHLRNYAGTEAAKETKKLLDEYGESPAEIARLEKEGLDAAAKKKK